DQVVKHQDGHASERKAKPEHEAGEVSGIKTFGCKVSPGNGSNGSDRANDERPLLHGLGHGRGHQVRLIHGGRGHLGSSSVAAVGGATCGSVAPLPMSRNCGGGDGTFCPAGTSFEVAFWLSCRARM